MTPDNVRRNILKTVAVGLLFGPRPLYAAPTSKENCAEVDWTLLLKTLFPVKTTTNQSLFSTVAAEISGQLTVTKSDLGSRLRQEISGRLGHSVTPGKCSPAELKKIFAEIDRTPAFIDFWVMAVRTLCRSPDLWDVVGYEGSSVEYGGYINRGFDDIDWLPPLSETGA